MKRPIITLFLIAGITAAAQDGKGTSNSRNAAAQGSQQTTTAANNKPVPTLQVNESNARNAVGQSTTVVSSSTTGATSNKKDVNTVNNPK